LYILIIITITLLFFSYLLGEFLPRMLGGRKPELTITLFGFIASIFLVLCFPFFYPFLKLWQRFTHSVYFESPERGSKIAKQEILDILEETQDSLSLEIQEKKIFESVVTFRDRIAREIMVPRVDTFCLPATTSIKDAATLLQKEGYSRTPVYRNTVDEILGVLMWRDILTKYLEYETLGRDISILEAPVETILRPVIYTPETKKVSHLLYEFRKKQMHLAIVVDEYGGTEGIVTIEDILEEIVGEIEDEYDEETPSYTLTGNEGWIVDARMSIYDIKEHLNIDIPSEGDYDTLGGYVFYCAGSIPSEGFTIQHDDFTLRVLSSTDRYIKKVKIKKCT
ncbi:hemolysin family protein, partial [Chlamydiales bacterium]|nr:hemolysin family protein [Chlamydiales bacterium]